MSNKDKINNNNQRFSIAIHKIFVATLLSNKLNIYSAEDFCEHNILAHPVMEDLA